jgi:hypothetical protein
MTAELIPTARTPLLAWRKTPPEVVINYLNVEIVSGQLPRTSAKPEITTLSGSGTVTSDVHNRGQSQGRDTGQKKVLYGNAVELLCVRP